PCASGVIEPYMVFSWSHDSIISTVATEAGEDRLYLDWIPTPTSVDLVVTLPGGSPFDPKALDASFPSLTAANAIARTILALNSPSDSGQEPASKCNNHAGCDVINDYPKIGSCSNSNLGACCDAHDVCIHDHCDCPKDSGNPLECLQKQDLFVA